MDPHGVGSDEFHLIDRDIEGDGRGIENPRSGPLIDALRALTFAPREAKCETIFAVWPDNAQDALAAERLEITGGRKGGHSERRSGDKWKG